MARARPAQTSTPATRGSKTASKLWPWFLEKLTAAFWTLLTFLLILYGNGEHDLVTLVLFSGLCSWPFVLVGIVCWGINGALFIYVCGWLQAIRRVERPLDDLPWAMQLGSACFATAFVSLTLGIWPVFGFLSPVIVVVVTYGLIMSLNFVPHFGLLRPITNEPLTSLFEKDSATASHAHAD